MGLRQYELTHRCTDLHVDPSDSTVNGGRDGQPLRNRRVQWWDQVNSSWLTLLQRQLEWSSSKQALHSGQSLLDMAALERIGDEVIKLSEVLFEFGQVDIQSGIDEARIIDGEVTRTYCWRLSLTCFQRS